MIVLGKLDSMDIFLEQTEHKIFGCCFLSKDHLCVLHNNGQLSIYNIPENHDGMGSEFTPKDFSNNYVNHGKSCCKNINSFHRDQIVNFNFHNEVLSILYAKNVLVAVEWKKILSFIESDDQFPVFKKWMFNNKVTDFYPIPPIATSCVSPVLYHQQEFLNGNVYLCTGSMPTIGIYYTEIWKRKTSLANAVAFVDSAFSTAKSFISKHKTTTKKVTATSILPCELSLVQHFNDPQRTGQKICDVWKRFAFVKDNLGRFFLFDIKGCVVLRIWKGFRESEGFFLVDENNVLYCAILSRLRQLIFYWKAFDEKMHHIDLQKDDFVDIIPVRNRPNSFYSPKNMKLITVKLKSNLEIMEGIF